MTERACDVENLLREALSPVEPPAELEVRIEIDLGTIVDRAADELEAWELVAMRNPRNWVRPAGALLVGSAAAIGLVVIQTRRHRHQRRKQADNLIQLTARTVEDFAQHARESARRLLR